MAPAPTPTSYIGATALAVAAAPVNDAQANQDRPPQSRIAPQQTGLFSSTDSNVIPFEEVRRARRRQETARLQPPAVTPVASGPPLPNPTPKPQRSGRKSGASSGQGSLDLRATQSERTLNTGVPAQIYGDARVAPPALRLAAALIDAAWLCAGFVLFAGTVVLRGGGFGSGKTRLIVVLLSAILLSCFYGLLWTISRRETAGMHHKHLRLVTFDGAPLNETGRAVRFVAAWLSYCSCGLGLLWALLDEENLTLHDHISRTYPSDFLNARTASRH